MATLVDGRSSLDSLRYAWRELIKNYAHDSICGCSVDEVHDEMVTRLTTIGQMADAVADDALMRIVAHSAGSYRPAEIPIVVVNPSGFDRTGPVRADVLPDLDAPVGLRRFGWLQGDGVDLDDYSLLDATGHRVDFTHTPAAHPKVVDTLQRRKELFLDAVEFVAQDVPALGTATYLLVPRNDAVPAEPGTDSPATLSSGEDAERSGAAAAAPTLDNGILRVELEDTGTIALTDLRSGTRLAGLLGLLDEADAGDEYGFAAVAGDQPRTSDSQMWTVRASDRPHTFILRHRLPLPVELSEDRQSRCTDEVDVEVTFTLTLTPGSDVVEVDIDIHNLASDHRLRLALPSGLPTAGTVAESAYGVVHRDGGTPDAAGWVDRPSGVSAMRRFVAVEQEGAGLQIMAEGLHEYSTTPDGTVLVTLLRSVGWLARVDHPLRPHKIGPEIPTPGAQCLGRHRFRCALRPFSDRTGVGHLYRAAEAFSVPLQAGSPWERSADDAHLSSAALGMGLSPEAVVLSAVKRSEDRQSLVVRVFNSAEHEVTATLRPGFVVDSAQRCDLEEGSRSDQAIEADGSLILALRGAEIATVLLHTPSVSQKDLP